MTTLELTELGLAQQTTTTTTTVEQPVSTWRTTAHWAFDILGLLALCAVYGLAFMVWLFHGVADKKDDTSN